jgi:signal transduction histidine kinase
MGRNLESIWWINNDWDWKDIERYRNRTDRFSIPIFNPIKILNSLWRSKITYFRYQSHLTQLDHWNLVKMLLTLWKDEETSFKNRTGSWFHKISVTDSGIGIQKKQFKRVFEPGFTTKRGWGLGLSLTKRL